MTNTQLPSALIVGSKGLLADALASELRRAGVRPVVAGQAAGPVGAEILFWLRGPESDAQVAPSVEAVARMSERFLHICVVETAPAPLETLMVEDALRYLAAQRGATLSVLRASPEAFVGAELVPGLAALVAMTARRSVPGLMRGGKADDAPPVALPKLAASREKHPDPVVLVTGAAGQIGRAMIKLLDEAGIRHLDADIVDPANGAPSFIGDLSQESQVARLKEFCRPVTHVLHLASRITNEKNLAEGYRAQFQLNVAGTQNLLKALPLGSLRHVAFASSMTVYGPARTDFVDESHPIAPNCLYALTKVAAERALTEYSEKTGVPVAILRYTSAYGPGPLTHRAIPQMIAKVVEGQPPEIFGEGSARRDYIYVDDLVAATLKAVLKEAGGVFNIGTGVGISSAELAHLLVKIAACPAPPVRIARTLDAQAQSSLVFDVSKMRKELGFTPQFSLEEGLGRTIRHYQAAKLRRLNGNGTAAGGGGGGVVPGAGQETHRA